ncbi:FKBP-type peptidyl-prolyl cis-trans isomerase N-terminal domain-containing protein [Erwinia sp. Eh17-17]|uniref:FKBP-type peptidyl-prolyl cis-trans isomerase N-terminal domain-containing protein n=1 Tax=Erwinia sp. Eh17-17 TaxID=3080330 RepID=UPI0032080627
MMEKYRLPFALSAVSMLVVSLLGTNHLYAAETEAPAVLEFATSLANQEKKQEAPVTHMLSPPDQQSGARPHVERPVSALDSDQLEKLRQSNVENVSQKDRERIQLRKQQQAAAAERPPANPRAHKALVAKLTQSNVQKDRKINQLKKQIALLQHSAAIPAANTPTHDALVGKLAEVNKQLKDVQDAEKALRIQLQAANDAAKNTASPQQADLKKQVEQYQKKIAQLESQLAASSSNLEKLTAERKMLQSSMAALTAKNASASLAAIKQQGEQYQKKIAQLENQLAASSSNIEKLTVERKTLQSSMAALTAKNTGEQQKFDQEKQRLLKQISEAHQADSQAEKNQQQQLLALKEKLTESQQRQTLLQNDKAKLQSQLAARPTSEELAKSQLTATSLQAKLDELQLHPAVPVEAASSAAEKEKAESERRARDEKLAALQTQLDSTLAKLATSEKQRAEMKPQSRVTALTPEKLNQKNSREAYAIGMSLGDEILQIQAENSDWDGKIDKQVVLSGIIDAFQGQAKLSAEVITKTLAEVSNRVKKDQQAKVSSLDKATRQYLQRFTKMKNTKKSPSGFWYNISYQGDTPLPKNATLDVVVKESLTNGQVITDMDINGSVLTQPLSAFPPVFREALQKLKNHGSVTLVVPPELAYKDKGMPPKIPPNATMVYDLRIAEVYPGK